MDRGAEIGGRCLEGGDIGGDLHALVHLPDLESDIDGKGLGDVQSEVAADDAPEPVRLDGEFIVADGELPEHIVARLGGGGFAGQRGFCVGGSELAAGTAAPEGSMTRPVKVPRTVCAGRTGAKNAKIAITEKASFMLESRKELSKR